LDFNNAARTGEVFSAVGKTLLGRAVAGEAPIRYSHGMKTITVSNLYGDLEISKAPSASAGKDCWASQQLHPSGQGGGRFCQQHDDYRGR
jgi:hypothetical protein